MTTIGSRRTKLSTTSQKHPLSRSISASASTSPAPSPSASNEPNSNSNSMTSTSTKPPSTTATATGQPRRSLPAPRTHELIRKTSRNSLASIKTPSPISKLPVEGIRTAPSQTYSSSPLARSTKTSTSSKSFIPPSSSSSSINSSVISSKNSDNITNNTSTPTSNHSTPSPLTRSTLGHHRLLLLKSTNGNSTKPASSPAPSPSVRSSTASNLINNLAQQQQKQQQQQTAITTAPTTSPSVYGYNQGNNIDNDDDDLVTQVPEQAELDEEMQAAIQAVIQAHSSQLSGLRRVLSSADHGSSMAMHLLHAEIKLLQDKIASDQLEIDSLKKTNSRLSSQISNSQTSHVPSGSIVDVLSASNDADIRRYFRTLTPSSRLHLLHLLLEAAIPGDISSLRRYLEKIERSKRDFIGTLPDNLAVRCLLFLDLRSILNVRLVSHRWDNVVTKSGLKLWRSLSLALTSHDDEPAKPRENTSEGWFELYKGLHYREENWRKGLAQRVVVLKGHTGSIGALKLRGITLVTGSLDGSLRIWNVRTSHCLKIVKMPAPISSLDFYGQYGPTGVIAAGGNDVGRVFLISMNGSLLSTLSGHNKGIRTLAMNSQYLVSGGYDKALVVWNWREGTRIVKFGQQTNPCAAISLFGSTFSSVQVDGVIRCFSITNRELVSQHKVQTSQERGTEKIGVGGDVFQWFVAEARRVIIATKTKIYQLEYNLQKDGVGPDGLAPVDLASPPRLISLTPIKHELNSGTLDVLKRRFAAAPRFATRLGDDMRIFLGHLPEHPTQPPNTLSRSTNFREQDNDEGEGEEEEDSLQPIGGAWLDADARVSSRNPTCMSLSSDQLVVGCSDGLLYALDFCGTEYRLPS
ncbi:hypothetical protein PGT21_014266 [Puccinia graminis f. sp. tritici]|uniref:F-box domain-containing protein n=1 Tax=Puccinia graminis f. sp. tritici TaxID=56615 RepID=A0A5B0M4E2_PUCGR|nr:hypothetical protein PGT21_014266 [Puccinia graminis f. sp. tritici]